MTDLVTPTPSSPPSTAPAVTPPVTPSAPVAVTRPEAIAENFWDATANTIKLDQFVPHYSEVAAFHKAETEKRTALAARKPEDIKLEVKLPETVKVPDGMDLKINDKDPRVPIIREMAIKRGWDQDTVNELVALDAQQQIAAHTAEQTRIAAEDAKLGANASARKAAVGNALKGLKDNNKITADEYEAVKIYATDAVTVTALEKILAMATGSVPGSISDGNPPKPAEVPMAQRWYQPQKAS